MIRYLVWKDRGGEMIPLSLNGELLAFLSFEYVYRKKLRQSMDTCEPVEESRLPAIASRFGLVYNEKQSCAGEAGAF